MALPVFLLLIYCNLGTYSSEYLIYNGVIYQQGEAVRKDMEITEEFSGSLTVETVQSIWEKYGVPAAYNTPNKAYDSLRQAAEDGGNDNFSNRLIARLFCEETVDENGNTSYVLKSDLAEDFRLQGDFYFGYTGKGWGEFWEFFTMVWILASVVVLVVLCPTFSEDYAFRTADILLPTEKGRFRLWKTRLLAGYCFAAVYYWFLGLVLFVNLWLLYGLDGLRVSGHFTGQQLFMDSGAPLWKEVVILYLGCWLAILVLTSIVMAISTLCRKSFASLLWSIGLYFGPYAVVRILLAQMPVTRFLMWIQVAIYGLPFSYAHMCLNAPAMLGLAMTGVEIVVGGAAIFLSIRGWCLHQVDG